MSNKKTKEGNQKGIKETKIIEERQHTEAVTLP